MEKNKNNNINKKTDVKKGNNGENKAEKMQEERQRSKDKKHRRKVIQKSQKRIGKERER